MSRYVPTKPASRHDKNNFYQQLYTFLSSLAVDDRIVILNDFNARGCSREIGDQWHDVLGLHGHGLMNDVEKSVEKFQSVSRKMR